MGARTELASGRSGQMPPENHWPKLGCQRRDATDDERYSIRFHVRKLFSTWPYHSTNSPTTSHQRRQTAASFAQMLINPETAVAVFGLSSLAACRISILSRRRCPVTYTRLSIQPSAICSARHIKRQFRLIQFGQHQENLSLTKRHFNLPPRSPLSNQSK